MGHHAIDGRYDPNEPGGIPDWLVSRSADARIGGLMMRELGQCADVGKFGALASRASNKKQGDVEYKWAKILQDTLRSGGYVNGSGRVTTYIVKGMSTATWCLWFAPGQLEQAIRFEWQSALKSFREFVPPLLTLGTTSGARLGWALYNKQYTTNTLGLCFPAGPRAVWISLGEKHVHSSTVPIESNELMMHFELALSNVKHIIASHPCGKGIRSPPFKLGRAERARLEMYPQGKWE